MTRSNELACKGELNDVMLKKRKNRPHAVCFNINEQCSIFPGRRQPSIFDDEKLNFCVRDENRWTFSLSPLVMV